MSETEATVAPARHKGRAEPTLGGSTYVQPQDMEWAPTQFAGISIFSRVCSE
jgi:hypothetical protein